MKKISIVVPCYNEQEALPIFYEETSKVCSTMNDCEFEFVFVNDGSKDETFSVMKELAERDSRVKYVNFSRNFGKESAMLAGMDMASGDYVTIMDADLQDPPSLMPEMLRLIEEEDYDCVATRRVTRKGEPPIRSFFARMFYKLINKMSKVEMVDGARDYRFMKRKMVDAILSMREYNRYSKGLFSYVGFNTKWLEYENIQRCAGETKWSFFKLFLYAVEGIVGFTTVPLSIASVSGLGFCVLSFVMMIFVFVRALVFGDPTAGWPSLVCIILFVSGIQLLCLGIMGQYIAKAYLETKNRPIYIIRDTNVEKKSDNQKQ